MSTMLVRIKPYDPRRGHTLRRYTVNLWDTRFEGTRGWYEVPKEWADYLATVKQNSNDPYSKDGFDVCTKEQAERIDAMERAAAEPKAGAAHPYQVGPKGSRQIRGGEVVETSDPYPAANAVTTADLPRLSEDAADDFDLGAEEAGMSPQPAAPPPPQPTRAAKQDAAPQPPAGKPTPPRRQRSA